ncbi:MAG: hypothetical protein ACRENB_06825 [Gemmatimonadales bacterium]
MIWADVARRLEAAALVEARTRSWIPLNTCYAIPTRDAETALRLAAWLNTTWCRAAAAAIADPAMSGFARLNGRVASALPCPDSVLHDDGLLAVARSAEAGTVSQAELDERGAQLLGLTREDADALAALAQDRSPARR